MGVILNHPLFQRFENIPFILCNSGKHRDCCFLPIFRPYGTTHIASLRDYPHRVPTGLPTSRPYGTTHIPSLRVYPHRVPTGLRKTPGLLVSTHIPSLRDYGKHSRAAVNIGSSSMWQIYETHFIWTRAKKGRVVRNQNHRVFGTSVNGQRERCDKKSQ